MQKYKIFVTRKIPTAGLDLLKKECGSYQINATDHPLSRNQLLQKIKGCHAVLCLLNDGMDEEAMKIAGPQLKVISNYAAGYNNIQLQAAKQNKIIVTHTPDVLTETTAECAWALAFAVSRRVVESDAVTRSGKFTGWGPLDYLGMDFYKKTVGIIGAGRIGSAFAFMSQGFQMKVLYHSRSQNKLLEEKLNAKKTDLKTLLQQSDLISLHVPLTDQTQHLMTSNEFKIMKPTAILINTSRGSVMDEKALVQALKQKQIFGAGLDVYEKEPQLAKGLTQLKNVVITPHIGSATLQTRNKMAVLAVQNLIAALRGEKPPCRVI